MTTYPLLERFKGNDTERIPVWFMRQAGRYLPEYRKLREQHDMLSLIRNPELAAEVTIQPLRRFDLDGAIIFADILNILIGMGMDLEFKAGEGPVISNPIRSVEDVDRLVVPDTEENVGYTLEALRIVASELNPRPVTLIGFSGAPFTLSSYMIEGKSPKGLKGTKSFMYNHPQSWHKLQEKLVRLTSQYLIAQVKAGAQAVQLFDSWLGGLGVADYERFVAPYLKQIISDVKGAVDAPVVFFATGLGGIFPRLKELGADVVGVDWRVSLKEAGDMISDRPLQGNLDPLHLCAPREILEERVKSVLQDGKEIASHIFNTGHGLTPETPPDNISFTVDLIREFE